MFTSFFGNEEKHAALQSSLNDEGFVPAVLEAIRALPDEKFDAADATALFKLVPGIASVTAFVPAITDSAALALLLRTFEDPPRSLLNAQWAAVQAIATDMNLPQLAKQLPRLLSLVEPTGNAFAPFQVAVLGLLQSCIALERTRVEIGGSTLPATLAAIVKKFPHHTIAQRAVTAFVLAALENGAFGRPFAEAVLPLAVEAFASPEIEQRAFAWAFLKGVKPIIPVPETAWAEVVTIDAVVGKSYGGEIPAPAEVGDIGGAPNAQFMQLLLQMLAARR
jgi:hypothetical protein